MPAVVIPEGYALVSFEYTGANLPFPCYNTFGVATGATNPLSVCTAVSTEVGDASLRTTWALGVTLSAIRAKLGPNSTGAYAELATSFVGNSAYSPQGNPSNAVLVHKNSDLGGRRGRGRMYIPGIAETAFEANGDLVTAYRTTISALWENFLGGLGAASVPMYLLHAPGESALQPPSEVLSLTVDSKAATQRRRLRR